MVYLGVIVLLFLALFLYILLAPFYIDLDSTTGEYRFRFHTILSVGVIYSDGGEEVYFSFLGYRRNSSRGANEAKDEVDEQPNIKHVGRKKFSLEGISLRKLVGVSRSFQCEKCIISLDTGNMQLNGILFPVFYLLQVKFRHSIRINFVGENILILTLKNNLANMIWAYIKT